jgi:hypothetical protein
MYHINVFPILGLFSHSPLSFFRILFSSLKMYIPPQDALSARVAALELGDSFTASQTAVQQVQADCLRQLREIRTALGNNSTPVTTTSAAATDTTAALERKVAKLEYRVQHLVNGMMALYEKQNATPVE